LKTQAQRVLANAFAKYYYTGETRGIERWKEFVEFEKRKEKILRRTIEHWRHYMFYYVKSSFRNWMLNCDIRERQDQVKKAEMTVKDTQHQLNMQTNLFQATKAKLDEEMCLLTAEQAKYDSRLKKSVQLLVKNTDANHFMSKRRYILQQWHQYVKNEKAFINCIQNVISKSLWNQGF